MASQKNEITKSDLKSLAVVNSQIQISNNLLAEYDIYNELLNTSNITQAINLAISSRKFTDPFFDKNELKSISSDDLISRVLGKVYSGDFEQDKLYEITIPKNRIGERRSDYADLASYSIRYLIALVLFRKIRISDSVFGGKDEIFVLRNSEEDPYQKNNEDFWSWQKEVIKSGEFKWVYIADIKKYYDNISIKVLSRILNQEFGLASDRFLSAFSQCFEKLTIGSMCDHFIQNIYLTPLDNKLLQKGNIRYSRLTDDIRIFCKNESDAEGVHQLVLQTISDLGLSLNEDKQFIIKPIKYVQPDKAYALDYHQYAYDSSQKEIFSHYIEISDIDKFDVENILNLTFGTYDSFTWCNPKYDFKALPWKITFNEILNGDTGFKLGSIDINYFIANFENSENSDFSLQDLEELGKVIYFSYGNYKFYFRIIRLYFKLLLRLTDSDLSKPAWDKLIASIPNCRYKRYVFWRTLFSMNGNDQSYFDYLNNRKDIRDSFKNLISNVLSDESNTSYLSSEVLYILKNGLVDSIKFNDEVFWKSESFWNTELELIENEKSSYRSKLHLLGNIVEILPEALTLREKYAEELLEIQDYRQAYKEFKYLQGKNYDISLFSLAYCCFEIGLKNDSMIYYSKYIEKEEYSGAYNNRAILYKELNDFSNALSDYSTAISLEPEELYFSNRGQLLYEMGNFEAAIKDFDSAYSFEKKPKFLKEGIKCLLKLEKTDDARVTYIKYYNEIKKHHNLNGSFEEEWNRFQQNPDNYPW